MSKFLRTRVILLKKIKYGEGHLILHGLLPNGEKLSLLARGALRSKKRFGGGVLEPTHYVEIQYSKSNQEDGLAVLQEATLLEDFKKIRSDYDRLQTAFFILESVQKVSQEGDVHSEGLFNLTGHALRALQEVESLPQFRLHFSLKLLHQQGVLEPEVWMHPFLRTPLNQWRELKAHSASAPQSFLLEGILHRYLHTAEF